MGMSSDLREISAAARPLIETWLDIGEQIAALRDTAAAKGIDWSQLKALLKAQIQDERDDTGTGKRVKRIVERAEYASSYADLLGFANLNEENFLPDHDPETGEITEPAVAADAPEAEPAPQVAVSGATQSTAARMDVPLAASNSVGRVGGDAAGDPAEPAQPSPAGTQALPVDTMQSAPVGEVLSQASGGSIPPARATPDTRTMDEVQAKRAATPGLIRGWTPKQPRPAICLDHSCDSYGPDGFMPCFDCLRVARAAA